MRHLSSLHAAVSQWQAQIFECIGQVNREITALEQMKDVVDGRLREKQLYGRLVSDCLALINSSSSAVLRQDLVLTELKKEEKLTNEIREQLQKQICVLLSKLSSLKEVCAQLLEDLQDKGEAIKLITKCIILGRNTPSYQLPAVQCNPNHVSYDNWLSHCKNLRLTVGNLLKESSSIRGNLRLILANVKNALEQQRRSTDNALKRKIHELSRVQETLIFKKQRIRDEISDLTLEIQKVLGHIRNCDSKLHQASHRLDILNQRSRRELCLDQPYISFTLEKSDLVKMLAGFHPILTRSQRDLELACRRLMIVEDKLAKNARALELEQKCQNLHLRFRPALEATVLLANKPKLPMATGHSCTRAYLL